MNQEKHHCISCRFFKKHKYDYFFLQHTCFKVDDDELEDTQLTLCPECGATLKYDEYAGEDYCPKCGLVSTGPIRYNGTYEIDYPYGLKL